MRISHEKVAKAFLAHRPAAAGNLATDGEALLLHGNQVARWDNGVVVVTWAGWVTNLTAAVVNAVAECMDSKIRLCRVNWESCARHIEDGTTWQVEPDQWITL